MAKVLRQSVAALLAIIMCFSTLCIGAFSASTTDINTTWYGDELEVDVKAGQNGYTLMSAYVKPRNAYEMSYHMVTTNGTNFDIPQTLVIVDASKDYTWTPNGLYSYADSNYEVLYCCDAETGYNNGVYYKRMNLEDSNYYTAEEAAHIRAIVMGSYPYVSVEQMKANLAADGFEGAEELTRSDIIAAVQSAIWYFANGEEYYYGRTFHVPANSQWGGIMHDYTSELDVWWPTGKRKFATNDEVGARINALIDYLKNQDAVYAENNEVVISDLQIVDYAPVQEKNGVYTVALQVELNNSGSSSSDDIEIKLYVDGEVYSTKGIEMGHNVYNVTVEAKSGSTIKASVEGTQNLPQGVYFYEPEGGRDASQCLVGIAAGETNIYSEAEVTMPAIEEAPETADVELNKIDEKGNALSGAEFDLFVEGENAELFVGSYAVDANGKLSINDLLPGSYRISESVAPLGHYKLQGDIEFTVTEDGEIEIVSLPEDVTAENGGKLVLTVVNTRIHAQVSFSGTKFFNGLRAEGFSFALKDENGNVVTVKSDKNGNFAFPELRFEAEGIYTFEVYEIAGNDKTIVYDDRVYEIEIEVYAEDGDLFAIISVEKDGLRYNGGIDNLDFRNHTVVATKATVSGIKYLDGKAAAGFEFALMNGNTLVDTAVSGADGKFSFELYYDEAGTYNYTVVEIAGNDKKIVYDNSVINVTVEVALNGHKLEASVESEREIVFKNMTTPEIVIYGEKYLDNVPAAGFEFALMDGDQVIASAISGEDGVFEIHLDVAVAGTLNYTVVEIAGDDEMIIYDDTVYDITIDVIVEDGTLKSTMSDVEIVFNNRSVKPVDMVMDGNVYLDLVLSPGFNFVLTEGDRVLASVSSDKNGHFELPTISFNRPGTYVYKFVEVAGDVDTIIYDESVYTIVAVVTLEGDSLVADVTVDYLDKSNPFKNARSAVSNTVVIENLDFYNWTIRTNATISGTKYLDGKAAAGFEFALMDGDTIIAIAESNANGEFTFILDCNATGVFNYTVVEIAGDDANIVYDDSVIDVTVTVVREDISLKATIETEREVVFNNTTIPPETTEPVESEEIPEEITDVPLDPTPDTTEPEITEPAPETTEPETEETENIPEDSTPLTDAPTTTEPDSSTDTGDNGIFIIIFAAVAVISLAVVATRKKNVEN